MPEVLETLALKYRPRRLSDFSGQQHIMFVIERMLSRWEVGEIKLPPGLIFTGLRGSGKTSLARVMAAYLNCEALSKPCGECYACQEIQNFRSPSVLEIDGASSGGVDTARDLKHLAALSHAGKYRVIVIDEIHAATKEFFSTLLKQLEEPPPDVLYVLVTTNPEAIPPAISSRCLQFDYAPISISDIVERLEFVCRAEEFSYEPPTLPLIAARAKGSMRGALMLLQQLAIANQITIDLFQRLYPDVLEEFAKQFIETAFQADHVTASRIISDAFNAHRDCNLMIDAITDHLRKIAVNDISQGKSQFTLHKIAVLISKAWDLRVRIRNANPADPHVVHALWYIYLLELAPTKANQIGSNRIPIPNASTHIGNRLDLDDTEIAVTTPRNETKTESEDALTSLLAGL